MATARGKEVDHDANRVHSKDVTIHDSAVVDYFEDFEPEDHEDALIRARRVGVATLELSETSKGVEFVKRGFESMQQTFDEIEEVREEVDDEIEYQLDQFTAEVGKADTYLFGCRTSDQMTSNECPTCGRDDFAHERDMKAHHTIAHGERLLDYQNPGECPTCGEIFVSAAGMKAHHKISHAESIAESRRVSRSIRQQVIDRDNLHCQRCDVAVTPNDQAGPDFQLHHIIPFAAGGPDHPDNLVTLCSDCHVAAHNQMRNILDERPEVVDELRAIVVGESED